MIAVEPHAFLQCEQENSSPTVDREVAAARRHQSDGDTDYPLMEKAGVAVDGKKFVPQDISEMESRMPETKENPPFDEMLSEDMQNLMFDMITFWAMQFFMFVIIHNNLHTNLLSCHFSKFPTN